MRNERMSRGWHLDTGQFITESRAPSIHFPSSANIFHRQYTFRPPPIYSNLFLHTVQHTSLRPRTLLVSSLQNHNGH